MDLNGQRPPWHRRISAPTALGVLLLAAVAVSLPGIHGIGREVDHLGNLGRFLARSWPPDLGVLPAVLEALGETARIAVVATVAAALIAIPLGTLAARSLLGRWAWPGRLLLAAVRSVPSLVWALLAVAVIGPSPLAGAVALTAYSIAYLATFAANDLDAADLAVPKALREVGASRLQAAIHGLWPLMRAQTWSHVLWMLEYNLRSAAIIGYVGAGGIGVLLHQYQEYAQWPRFTTVLLAILVLVVALDLLGGWIRGKLVDSDSGPKNDNRLTN